MRYLPMLAPLLLLSPIAAAGPAAPLHGTGFVQSPDWDLGVSFVRPAALQYGDLPAHFDWREQNGVTAIKNQGSCGSCWAFGSTAAFESVIKIRDGVDVSLAEQQLVSCDTAYNGCGGGDFAHDFQVQYGQTGTASFPYQGANAACKSGLEPAAQATSWAYVGDAYGSPSVDDIKQAIYQHGVVSTVVHAGMAMQSYSGGVFGGCGSMLPTNHLVALTGWDDAKQIWYMKNSWGASWGENGFMEIPWGCARIGEEAAFVVYKPSCENQPLVRLPRVVKVKQGATVSLTAAPLPHASYVWRAAGQRELGAYGPSLSVTPKRSERYTVRVTTECGVGESTTQVVVE